MLIVFDVTNVMERSPNLQRQVEKYFPTMWERVSFILENAGLKDENGEIRFADAEREAKIKHTVLSKFAARAKKKNGEKAKLGEQNLEKIQRTFHVKLAWLMTGRGLVYEENITPASKSEQPMESVDTLKRELRDYVKDLEAANDRIKMKDEIILMLKEKIEQLKNDLIAARGPQAHS